ncbi:S1C family serine protease [Gracilibacillus alcaliphilus]|uniref:S1C family serine protease n=1 Tax=Gracilibacillus alcaliphilus TaxID=1401441 RepID=UPI0019571B0F|nr:serine protease [Gracilibacillus alcaliphilus]MBM7675340.1 S1-C subfamily serine protease [Gracilibacillus alcaliphilus]
MKETDDRQDDIIDEDLYEEIDPEEMYELIQEERRKLQEKQRAEQEKPKKRFPKWIFWVIAAAMFIQVIAIFPQTFSIPAIQFIQTSITLMQDDDVRSYREAVVVIEGADNKGTGFAISEDGYILTNYHVIEDQPMITVAFAQEGLYRGEVVASFPEIDLALLTVEGSHLPSLPLIQEEQPHEAEDVIFIGNPLQFNGIANQGDIIGMTWLKNWDQPVYMLDAPVYRGNSGSPVINDQGEVIAVIFATQSHPEHGKIGLAVPINYFQTLYDKTSEQNPE